MSKEEWSRRRQQAEEGVAVEAGAEAPPPSAEAAAVKKKKKKPRERTTLSFAMDDGEEESAAEAVPKMPKKKNKLNPSIGASHALRTEVAPAAAPAAPAPPAPPSPPATLPAGHSCVRHVGEREGAVEVSIEAMASMSSARTKITGMASHGVSMTIQANEREANQALCLFLRDVLGGADTYCEVVRGHHAPVKVVQLRQLKPPEGATLLDYVYDRLEQARRHPERYPSVTT